MDRSRARGLMMLGNLLATQSVAAQANIPALCEQAEQRLFQLSEKGLPAYSPSLLDILNNVVQHLEEALSAKGITGTPTGFSELDEKPVVCRQAIWCYWAHGHRWGKRHWR